MPSARWRPQALRPIALRQIGFGALHIGQLAVGPGERRGLQRFSEQSNGRVVVATVEGVEPRLA